MSLEGIASIRKAVTALDPREIRERSEKPLHIALQAASGEAYTRMENFFLRDLSPARRRESATFLTRGPERGFANQYDLTVFDEGLEAPPHALVFRVDHPHYLVERILSRHPDLGISLAKRFYPFRRPYLDKVIAKTSRENALFSIATALPDVIPNIIELPWAVAEFASDTAFITMNQIRMAFAIAGASDRAVGYLDQKSEVAMVIGSAFGWRALARQLIGKIPFGGGLIAKAAVAYAGTKVLGLSLDHFYSIGYTYTREERDRLYADAFRQGKKVAARILNYLRPDLAAKLARPANQPTAAIAASDS